MADELGKYYKVEGTGKSPESAEKALDKELKGLAEKVKDVKVESSSSSSFAGFKVEKVLYIGIYSAKKKSDATVDDLEFSVEAPKGWPEILEEADNVSDIKEYTPSFRVEKYLDLTAEQKKVIMASRGVPPAGEYEDEEGGLFDVINRLR